VLADGPGAQGFPKSARLLTRRDFAEVKRGRRVEGRWFVAYVGSRAAGAGARLGLAVSTRVGNAVCRNRVRRLAREAFRLLRSKLGDRDVLLVARAQAAGARLADLEKELIGACRT
jgi:ribonuclease P protein component